MPNRHNNIKRRKMLTLTKTLGVRIIILYEAKLSLQWAGMSSIRVNTHVRGHRTSKALGLPQQCPGSILVVILHSRMNKGFVLFATFLR